MSTVRAPGWLLTGQVDFSIGEEGRRAHPAANHQTGGSAALVARLALQ
jgi:hypothetical protein